MKSYWYTMPVVVEENDDYMYKCIVDRDYLLEKVNKELENAHVKFEYKLFEKDDFNEGFIDNMKKFFDEYYSGGIYKNSLYEYRPILVT